MHCVISIMRKMKFKFFAFAIVVFTVYLFLFIILIEVWSLKKGSPVVMTSVILPYVIMHVDLKGSPPKLEYLKTLLPMLKEHGVTGLLIEYEDMFPYEGKLVNLSARNCYQRTELQNFLQTAVDSGFEIIPLVQTFGHLEHALKLREFRHLREVPAYPDSICPSKLESRAMVRHMLEQIVKFHNNISSLKHIHVGCDEVFHINKCSVCLNKGTNNRDLYIEYVRYLSSVIEDLSPDTTMLIWDDMLREIKPNEWTKINCFNNIEPVYWDYTPNININHVSLLNYHKKFKNIWTASAFKGADGITATIPNIKNRIVNHFNWMKLILDYKFAGEDRIFNFKGIILTGWSRYSHMDPPCELLPVSIPSLILNLLIIRQFKSGIIVNDATDLNKFCSKYLADSSKNSKHLNCRGDLCLENFDVFSCEFESVELYRLFKQYKLIKNDIAVYFDNDDIMSSIDLYAKSKHISMNSLMTKLNWCNDTLNELLEIEATMINNMKRYYNKDFIVEYVALKLYHDKAKLKRMVDIMTNSTYNRVWERRPVNDSLLFHVTFK